MDQNEEFERSEHHGEFPPKEPNEPFLPDEFPEPGKEPSLKGLHPVNSPATNEKLAAFMVELRPIVEGIQNYSREDQYRVAQCLQEVKNALHAEGGEEKVVALVDKIADQFNNLLVHSAPIDQAGVIEAMNELEKLL